MSRRPIKYIRCSYDRYNDGRENAATFCHQLLAINRDLDPPLEVTKEEAIEAFTYVASKTFLHQPDVLRKLLDQVRSITA